MAFLKARLPAEHLNIRMDEQLFRYGDIIMKIDLETYECYGRSRKACIQV